jgi:hypothetical protein
MMRSSTIAAIAALMISATVPTPRWKSKRGASQSHECANHADIQVSDESESAAADQLTRQPASDNVHHDDDEQALIRKIQGSSQSNSPGPA